MIISNNFIVEEPISRVWSLFDELDQVVPCMPGAAYLENTGDDSHQVALKLKIGAISSNFQGTVKFLEKDSASHTVKIRGAAKDTGGKGSAAATISARLEALSATRTRVTVDTDLAMTGRVAQFGGPIIVDIANRLVGQFTENLHKAIKAQKVDAPNAAVAPAPSGLETSAEKTPAQSPEAPAVAPLDLGPLVGGVAKSYALKFLVPLLCLIVGFVAGKYL